MELSGMQIPLNNYSYWCKESVDWEHGWLFFPFIFILKAQLLLPHLSTTLPANSMRVSGNNNSAARFLNCVSRHTGVAWEKSRCDVGFLCHCYCVGTTESPKTSKVADPQAHFELVDLQVLIVWWVLKITVLDISTRQKRYTNSTKDYDKKSWLVVNILLQAL